MNEIVFKTGDMFASSAEALVNTVNCVGVMGKGVALEFKRRWAENYKFYKRACDRRELRPGAVLVFDRGDLFGSEGARYLVNFPTKDHWRSKSKLEYIDSGLDSLVSEIRRLSITSIALPPLGCGNGGLDWAVVRPLMQRKLSALDGVRVEIYGPLVDATDPEYIDVVARMTRGRALYLKAIASLEPRFGGSIDRLSLQKIAYFLQNFGVPLNLEFRNSLYGPYSESLKKALIKLDGWRYITGLVGGDRNAKVTSAGYAAADEYLRVNSLDEVVIDKLSHLFQGYDSPYGLELLSTTHFKSSQGLISEVREDMGVSESNAYRRNLFTRAEVQVAKIRLIEDGLLDQDG
ncbi:macro domain-containing protein [Stenotrophomonas sp. LARHCG68]